VIGRGKCPEAGDRCGRASREHDPQWHLFIQH
jgi:hypothetical protein